MTPRKTLFKTFYVSCYLHSSANVNSKHINIKCININNIKNIKYICTCT